MEYYFNNLNPISFQRLINGMLVIRYGEAARLTPLRGADGGRDAETAAGNPFFEYKLEKPRAESISSPVASGRYLFQVKHHRTVDLRPNDARAIVIGDFVKELKSNVLTRTGDERVNYFFLITNVPASKDSIQAVDEKRTEFLTQFPNLHADVWWQERVMAMLDQSPSLWSSFPELFAGGKVPFLADVVNKSEQGLSRAVRVAIGLQYQRDSLVKFKQIELERSLTKLFVDLDVDLRFLRPEESHSLISEYRQVATGLPQSPLDPSEFFFTYSHRQRSMLLSALGVLLNESNVATRKILLEGGPGQGKSTITQMMAQIYRSAVLLRDDLKPEGRWLVPEKKRLPLRLELRNFAEWLGDNIEGSVEEYLATILHKDSGGSHVNVDDIHNMVENSPVLLIFDGLDEVGSADLREAVLLKIAECVERFETTLHSDLRVIVTTRPPAIAGRREQLASFRRFPIAPMEQSRIQDYLDRWLFVQVHDEDERKGVRVSFERRQNETHVKALAKNPMQLSVLLHFIRLKGEAFPDRRAELYRDYFRIVIDRDVEKSSALRQQREVIETLHQLLGYRIHSLTEADKADGTLRRSQLLGIIQAWMSTQGGNPRAAAEIFSLGEERLGLIVALRGEGEETRYGYEIQPIREYFAAAYINEQIEGNAHEVFQSLVSRPYWKEVALFLAGLRRPNEKADLITRAKEIDKNPTSGWRQDGRALVLQLLQEGVFSQPRHVFAEALDFMLDLLDPSVVSAPNEPKEMLDILPTLIKQGDVTRPRQRVIQILNENMAKGDVFTIYRAYRVLARLLEPDDMRELLLQHHGPDRNMLANVLILWPGNWGIDMTRAASKPAFWQRLPEDVAARALWNSALMSDLTTGLAVPSTIHSQLLVRFALTSDSIFERGLPDGITIMRPSSNLAIWQLVSVQQALASELFTPKVEEPKPLSKLIDIDYAGLDGDTKEVVSTIINSTRTLLEVMSGNEVDIRDALQDYVSTLVPFLDKGGLAGLVAGRTGLYLIDLLRYSAARGSQRASHLLSTAFQHISLGPFSQKLLPFLGIDGSLVKKEAAFSFVYQKRYREAVTPTHLRLQANGPFVEMADLIAQSVCDKSEWAFSWLKTMPINATLLRPLVEKCRDDLESLLVTLSERQFELNTSGPPLVVQNIQRILKIARNTEDPALLEGCLVALSTSKFLKMAGSDTVLKLIRSANRKAEVSQALFTKPREDVADINVLTESASSIVQHPGKYPFGVRIAAAYYLADHVPVSQPPLVELQTQLGLQIQAQASYS